MFKLSTLKLYFVLDPAACLGRDVADVARAALRGGVSMIQLRNKFDSADIVLDQAMKIKEVMADSLVPFIINDHVEIAAKLDADGVHIGQGDMSPEKVRGIIGADKILGLTAFTKEHYSALNTDHVDYVGTGPVFPTKTDKGKPVLSVDGFRKLIKHAPVPVVGIGGITKDNARDVIAAGAHGIAMMRSISEADDPCQAAKELLKSMS